MEIKLLNDGYKRDTAFYQAFLDGTLQNNYLSEEFVTIGAVPDFPVYLGQSKGEEKEKQFLELVKKMKEHFVHLDRGIYMQERFWHSYLCLYKREYILANYPQVLESEKEFRKIVIKDFDWENYIYKAILVAQYVEDYVPEEQKEKYYRSVIDNMDIFNYIIKYEIFRNGHFLINVLSIIEENNLSKILKSKIKNRPDLGKDERYGRRVIFELNKSYPQVMAPMLEKEQLQKYFMKFLGYYYQGEQELEVGDDEWEENNL